MANTTVVSGNQVQQWEDKFFAEYVRDSIFMPYMGTTENDIIQVKEDLTRAAGKTINVPLVTRLTNSGVTGDNTLEGNEEALGNYNHAINIDQIRNGVRVGKMEQKHTVIELLNAARTMLKLWCMDDLRDDCIQAFYSPVVDGVTAYAAASEAQKDAWQAANNPATANQRILFGYQKSQSSGDHSADLTKLDTTNDKLDFDIVQLAKRMAKTCDPHIRPVKVKGGREFYVMFCGSYPFRDLKVDTETIHTSGHVRGDNNPLFQDPDLLLDGVICREVPEIGVLSNVGASGTTDCAANFLCGAQALGLAWGQRPKFATESFDYYNLRGVAVAEVRGTEKLSYNSVQHGQVTVYTTAVGDS